MCANLIWVTKAEKTLFSLPSVARWEPASPRGKPKSLPSLEGGSVEDPSLEEACGSSGGECLFY